MARALEYIINYPLKRNIVSKSTINVLEIMPDKDCKDYDDLAGQVENWLGLVSGDSQLTITGVCCAERGYGKENINDDLTKYWHTLWNGNSHLNKSPHYIEAELDKPEDIKDSVIHRGQQTMGMVFFRNGRWNAMMKKVN